MYSMGTQTRFGQIKQHFWRFLVICHHRTNFEIFLWLVLRKSSSSCSVLYCFCILSEVFWHSKLLYGLGKKVLSTPLYYDLSLFLQALIDETSSFVYKKFKSRKQHTLESEEISLVFLCWQGIHTFLALYNFFCLFSVGIFFVVKYNRKWQIFFFSLLLLLK